MTVINMNILRPIILSIILLTIVLGVIYLYRTKIMESKTTASAQQPNQQADENPLSITAMRQKNYPGSDIVIEKTLAPGSNYNQYLASYQSDGLKIYALLTVPREQKPQNGWPVILFNHGYIPPKQYQTTERYGAYVDAFARNGYIVFKPDFRGNGNSEGQPEGAYYSPAYTIDDLNALASIKKYKDTDPNKIGVWGHSMGGNIALRDLVVNPQDIKAVVIWGGVVGSYNDLMNNWQNHVSYRPPANELALRNRFRQNLINQYGTPQSNPTFWNSIDPTYYVADIAAPVQLDVGGADEEVPVAFSESLYDKLQAAGKTSEFYVYPGSDHNISQDFDLAMQRSLTFFDKYLK